MEKPEETGLTESARNARSVEAEQHLTQAPEGRIGVAVNSISLGQESVHPYC